MTRRSLLQRLLVVLGIDAAGLTGCASRQGAHLASSPLPVAPAAPAGMLSSADLEDIVAFAEVLVEDRFLTDTERGYLVQHIEHRAQQSPDHLALYQTTARTLERLAGRRVAALDFGERVELVTRHRLGSSRVSSDEDLGPFPEEVRAVRRRAVRDLVEGYYASPAGWAAVGYATFPGRCGDLTRYVRPES